MAHSIQIVFQTNHPRRLGEFWRAALGYVPEPPPDGYDTWEDYAAETASDLSSAEIDSAVDPSGRGPRLLFEHIDRPTTGDAVHLDINVTKRDDHLDTTRQAVERKAEELQRAGAHPQRTVDTGDRYWIEMADPDGNWFCVQ